LTRQFPAREALTGRPYCLMVPPTVFEQWSLNWWLSPIVTSLFEQN
jgi:hypothetical protein